MDAAVICGNERPEAVVRMLLATGQVNRDSENFLGADSALLGGREWARGGDPAAAR